MTSDYPPEAPLQYQTPPPPSRRPRSVTVLAIIGIVLGALGGLCSPLAIVPYFVKFGPPNPVVEFVKADHAMLTYMIASMVVGAIFNLILFICAIGALSLKEWARKGMLFYGWATLALAAIGWILSLAWIYPKMWHVVAGTSAAPGFIGGIVGGLVGMLYPILVIVYMNKPTVRDAFADSISDPYRSGY